ncbi:MAG: glycosyltransferase family 9 protein [Planctomycetes bacterium]|nr:glycosyltransferase family 9 protein [Planctomycetota bacterium]
MFCSGNPRVVITRLSAIGDCILTLPVACAIRDQLPDAKIAWVTEPGAATLLRNHAAIDELIVAPKGWLKSPREIMNVRRRLRRFGCTVAIDPQSLAKSAIASWLSSARQRIGFAAPQGRELSTFLNNHRMVPKREHLVDRQLELLQPLGILEPAVRFDVARDAEAEASIRDWLDADGFDRFAVINPGAGWDSRLWPVERYAAVAAFLGHRFGLPSLVVWAGAREQAWADSIAMNSQGHAFAARSTRLPELASLLRRSTLFVGSDTGPMHLAAAVGTPCVAIHGPTQPALSGPYGHGHRAVQAYYQQGTSRQRRSGSNAAMLAVFVDDVCQACVEVLEDNSRPRLRVAG